MNSSDKENSFKVETRDRSLSEIDENKPPTHVSKQEHREIREKESAIGICEVLQSDMATELQDLKKSNKSLIQTVENLSKMMEKMAQAAERENDCLRQKLKEANYYIVELEEDLSSSKKIWTDFEMMTAQYENEMKTKMEELENLKMDYKKMENQWKEEITKRDEEIEMEKKEIETLRNEKAAVAVQISTAKRTIENNQLIDKSQAQSIDEEKKKYVVVVFNGGYKSLFEADNVVFIHFESTISLKDCISQKKTSYHKEMFVFTDQYYAIPFYNQVVYLNLLSISQQWKTFYPDAEIHVIGVDWPGSNCKPTAQIRQLWTSYNELIVSTDWTRDFTKAIAKAWSPHCDKLLSGEMKRLYL